MLILNLGSGAKTSPLAINIDRSLYFRIRRNPVLYRLAQVVMPADRACVLNSLPPSILLYDLSKGIPAPDSSVDAVYHSHVLEHLDRGAALPFMRDIYRVLKPGGVHRVVVPDLEADCRYYLEDLAACEQTPERAAGHDDAIARLIEYMVMTETPQMSEYPWWWRAVNRYIRADARTRGHIHRWMYDRISLPQLLEHVGFQEIVRQDYQSSAIANWTAVGLDVDSEGGEYRPGSLYFEAIKK